MPMFDFRCEKCNHVFEKIVKHSEKTECPKCQSRQTDRLISKPGSFVLKGSGFYRSGTN